MEHEEMVGNILDVYRSATAVQSAEGMDWYAIAHNTAVAFAAHSPYSVAQCAGVIAAFSPNNGWGNNKALAARIIDNRGEMVGGYLPLMINKAKAILAGTDADIAGILNGQKIVAFFESIAANGNTDIVCVDRHAYCIAIGERIGNPPSIGKRLYNAIADAYRDAGAIAGITGAQMQAITWVAWRERFWNRGAFNGEQD